MDEPMAQVHALYEQHGRALLRYLKGMTRRQDVAEDLLQDTFVQALRGLDRLRKASSPRAWLFSIARHLGLNAISRRRVTRPLPETLAAAPVHENKCDGRMREAIAALPDAQREALELRLRDELSYEEIAEVLQVPVGTVRSRLHNAVKTLRKTMKANEA